MILNFCFKHFVLILLVDKFNLFIYKYSIFLYICNSSVSFKFKLCKCLCKTFLHCINPCFSQISLSILNFLPSFISSTFLSVQECFHLILFILVYSCYNLIMLFFSYKTLFKHCISLLSLTLKHFFTSFISRFNDSISPFFCIKLIHFNVCILNKLLYNCNPVRKSSF